jgi:hypothetical protein
MEWCVAIKDQAMTMRCVAIIDQARTMRCVAIKDQAMMMKDAAIIDQATHDGCKTRRFGFHFNRGMVLEDA